MSFSERLIWLGVAALAVVAVFCHVSPAFYKDVCDLLKAIGELIAIAVGIGISGFFLFHFGRFLWRVLCAIYAWFEHIDSSLSSHEAKLKEHTEELESCNSRVQDLRAELEVLGEITKRLDAIEALVTAPPTAEIGLNSVVNQFAGGKR